VKYYWQGKKIGLLLNFHGDELHSMGSGKLGSELEATAISHLEKIDDEGIKKLSKKPTIAILLPSTAYILRIDYPPARKMIENNVPVALGSDFNPNAHCLSMPFIMNLACVNMKMTMNEALVASTLNAAASLEKSDLYGSIEIGKIADFIILNHSNWEHIIYELIDPPIEYVIKKGKIVFQTSLSI
jgi:imidazolonepropionase